MRNGGSNTSIAIRVSTCWCPTHQLRCVSTVVWSITMPPFSKRLNNISSRFTRRPRSLIATLKCQQKHTHNAKLQQREQVHVELSTAIALYRAMEMTFWLPQAEAALAQTGGAAPVRRGAD